VLQCNVSSLGLWGHCNDPAKHHAAWRRLRQRNIPSRRHASVRFHLCALNWLGFSYPAFLFKAPELSRSLSSLQCAFAFLAEHLLPLQLALQSAMLSTRISGGAGAGGSGGPGEHKRGCPFGSRNRAKDPAVTPPVPRKGGRPLGGRNKKTLAALAAAAAAKSDDPQV
jgi:hypothetical protein